MGFSFSLQPGHPVGLCQQSAETNEGLSGGEALQLLAFTEISTFSNADFLPKGVCVKASGELVRECKWNACGL